MKNRLMITVDVEARPARSRTDPLDRLIWGRFPEGEFGIGRMMSVAERHGVELTMFLDYAEEYLYGDALLDVGREIHRRGHDLQLHLHPEFMPANFFAALGLDRPDNLSQTSPALADAYLTFLRDRHARVGASAGNAFRGQGYLYSGDILGAMKRHGLRLSSNYNASRSSQPMQFGAMPPFMWDTGVIEAPIATVFDFRGTRRHFDYNFNAVVLNGVDLDTCLDRHLEFLDRFYLERGEDAVAVLVMHSWSFLERDAEGIFSRPSPDAPDRFDLLLSALGESVDVIDSRQMVALADAGALRLAGPYRFGEVRTVPDGAGQHDAAPSPPSPPLSPAEPVCPICGTAASLFVEFNGGRRRCPGCLSLERQRVFAQNYEIIRREFDLADKEILAVAPSGSERRFLAAQGVTNLRTVDVRPEVKPDFVADICHMPQVPDASFDAIIASGVLMCVYDLDACLSEFCRVLRPGGRLLSADPVAFGQPTEEFDDIERITAWYGREIYDKYRVGNFRSFGDTDLILALGKRFIVKTLYGYDEPTNTPFVWHMSIKPV
ncbi:MAG TPA: methyltransferase domain-containing protein, partial [Thermomicrobiales bacterium]|nr:methyltransferase domain-containing protein [Thermomicrobiales bacterium]